MPKTFTIQTAEGPEQAEQVGTFTYYPGGSGSGYRFVLTRRPPHPEVAITHRATGMAVVKALDVFSIVTNRGDYARTAKEALDKLVARIGANEFRRRLDAAERK